jgi:NAD(P)-dependent dehydrogenase (short-subunit alcohol dehydrogenase family)
VHSNELGTVIVSGAASGLGAAVAQAVQKVGGRPVSFDVRAPDQEIEHEIVDIADADAVADAVDRVARSGGLNAVVTCAGIDSCGRLQDVPFAAWERVVRVNLLGTAALVRPALPYLESNRGRVVTVASTLGLRAVSDATAYCASKFGVIGFTRALMTETAGTVGVTLLVPGGMHTSFFDDRDEKYKPPADAKLNAPEDVASSVVFALQQPAGCEIRELVVCPSMEGSYP